MSERQGVEIDYCPTCRGVWLDRGELDKIIERASDEIAPVERQRTPDRDGRDGRDDRDGRRDRDDRDDRYRTEPYRNPDPRYVDQYGRPHKKKKSFLSEMFEFGD